MDWIHDYYCFTYIYSSINNLFKLNTFYSNGKLLLTGEYVVLDGALALAVPTKLGQALTVKPNSKKSINWKSIDANGNIWFESVFKFKNNAFYSEEDNNFTKRLIEILNSVKQLNPSFFNSEEGYSITTKLDFPQNWGLGSSSTLINNIAKWTNVDAYKLLELTFGGSGYDIACAAHNSAITYQLNSKRNIKEVDFKPNFSNQLFFIHLNQKQNSREGIKHYNSFKNNITKDIKAISDITLKIINCTTLNSFEALILEHENIISKITKQDTIKNRLFRDYNGAIKSLGAWGGDFILASGSLKDMEYFTKRGYTTIVKYKDMIL